jgi:diaminohydroxyphosphoribosylaminopyrimidine deaminase/5-amino-6-(5-phosphoribosylamino)uracil reductase
MTNKLLHEMFMKRCIELASNGLGSVAPNPMVGSILVCNNKIIGEGYHQRYGEAHAEVNAINSVSDKNLLSQSTLYVNLEPCSHFGKTPPCSDLIIKSQIPKVVIANIDPNPKVQGGGIKKLKAAGIEVITGVLEQEGESINKRFFTFQRKKRPYIILKWAQTQDGFIDSIRQPEKPQQPNWITNQYARMLVHKWRSEEQAILAGTNTAYIDNPKLNVRDWVGKSPLRVVIDRTLRLPGTLNIFDNSLPTLIFTEQQSGYNDSENCTYKTITFDNNLPEYILNELHSRGIQSMIIEGGAKLLNSFITAGLWDEARVFVGDICFTNGIPAPKLNQSHVELEKWKGFSLYIYRNSL